MDSFEASLLGAVFEHVPDMIFVKDARTLAFLKFNSAGEQLLGWSREELIGKCDHDFYPKAQADAFQCKDREALAADDVVEIPAERIETKHGVRWLHTKKIAVRERGKPRFLLGISRDITAEVQRSALREAELVVPPPRHELGDAMRQALSTAELAARDREVPVLLLGETGVGKGWFARRIHDASPRTHAPFVEVNCASLSRDLLESELFGHEKGSFSGADRQKLGLVEAAEGGTLFLDEVGEMPLALQTRLLTYLDDKRFRRVGGNRSLQSDVRVLAATNASLRASVDAGRFRRDLYYRLGVVPIEIPPLRRRRDEIPRLAAQLLAGLLQRRGRRLPALSPEVVAVLAAHDWPGNVRELRNALERAVIVADGAALEPAHFALSAPSRSFSSAHGAGGTTALDGPLDLASAERRHVAAVLAHVDGNRSKAARLLGISRVTLRRKLLAEPSAADPYSGFHTG
jgi:PAS domain S-box-containing protein